MNGRVRTVVAVRAAAALLLVGMAGCSVVDRPDTAAWDSQARTALTDAAGEVATARLVLETAADGETWSSYAVVTLADAEEAADTLASDLAKVQPPAARREEADQVLDLLQAASSAVREARQAALEEAYDDEALVTRLTTLGKALERASAAG